MKTLVKIFTFLFCLFVNFFSAQSEFLLRYNFTHITMDSGLPHNFIDHIYKDGIAYETGFNDPKYFTRVFTKHFGVQPSVLMHVGNN